MANSNSTTAIGMRAKRLRRALLRQYLGLLIRVEFIDHVALGYGTYRGWLYSFRSTDPNLLLKYKLVPGLRDFDSKCDSSELVGVSYHAYGIMDDSKCYGVMVHIEEEPHSGRRDSAMTKTMQAQVMRMLKPFIRGTWKPRESA